jgi:hypothetical protein
MRQAGFRGGFESGTICPRVRRTSSDAKRTEGPTGVDRAGCAAGDRVGPADPACRCDLGIHHETLRKHVRQAEADGGLGPDLPTTEQREEIKALRKEVFELRRANEILKAASVFFATELDADRTK